MEIKVQSVHIETQKNVKDLLVKMRQAVDFIYEYSMVTKETLIRFSASEPVPVLALIYVNKYQLNAESDDQGNFDLIYQHADSIFAIVKVKSWLISGIEYKFLETIQLEKWVDKRLIVTQSVANYLNENNLDVIEDLSDSEINQSEFVLKSNESIFKKHKKKLALIFCLLAFISYNAYQTYSDMVKTTVKEIKVKKIKIDHFYEYKQEIKDKVTYHEIYKPILAASLMKGRLPRGWSLNQVLYQNNLIIGSIKNANGRVKVMEHYKEISGYKKYMDVDGQFAKFEYKVKPYLWWEWTKKTADFYLIRDEYIDQMIILGAKIRSNNPVVKDNYITQLVEIQFSGKNLSLLDYIVDVFDEKPIFIETMVVNPKDINSASISITATIIGKNNDGI